MVRMGGSRERGQLLFWILVFLMCSHHYVHKDAPSLFPTALNFIPYPLPKTLLYIYSYTKGKGYIIYNVRCVHSVLCDESGLVQKLKFKLFLGGNLTTI